MEDAHRQRKEFHMQVDKKEARKLIKNQALVDLQRKRKIDESEDEALDNKELLGEVAKASDSENDDDLELERLVKKQAKKKMETKRQKVDDQDQEEEKQLFLNPLLAFKKTEKKEEQSSGSEEDEEKWSDDDKYEPKLNKEQRRALKDKEKKLLGKRKKLGIEGDIDDVKDFFKGDLETVPVEDLSKKQKKKGKDSDDDSLPSGYSSMDSEEIAETRALAKKMLRKKFREETIDASYSRYAWEDDEGVLPSWFIEDEARHNVPNYNLTKEEVAEEKRQLMEWNARPSKKVMEAKGRKKMRLVKAMTKIKNKAQVVANQDISEGSKMK